MSCMQYEGNMCVKVLGVQTYKCKKGVSVKSVSYFSVMNMTLHDATLRMDTLWCTEHYIHTRSLPIVISLCITCSRTPEGKISWPCAGLKSSPAVAVISNVLYSTDATPVTSRPRRTATTLERGRRMRKERMWVSVHVIVYYFDNTITRAQQGGSF